MAMPRRGKLRAQLQGRHINNEQGDVLAVKQTGDSYEHLEGSIRRGAVEWSRHRIAERSSRGLDCDWRGSGCSDGRTRAQACRRLNDLPNSELPELFDQRNCRASERSLNHGITRKSLDANPG